MKAENEAEMGIHSVSTSSEASHSTALPGHCEASTATPTEGSQGPLLDRGEATLKPSPDPAQLPAPNP